MTAYDSAYDSASFSAGQDCGTRVAAVVARLAALELIDHSRWWNRWRHRLMARALVACAEDMECAADAGGRPDTAEMEGESIFRRALAGATSSKPSQLLVGVPFRTARFPRINP